MADSFVVAPSVQWTETDATLTTLSGLVQNAGSVGQFAWGPADYPVRITSGETGLVETFWKPTKDIYLDFLVLADFFRYSQSAWVVRVVANDALNAVPEGSTAELIKNYEDIEAYAGTLPVFARYPGELGNNLNVLVVSHDDLVVAKADYNAGFRTGLAYIWSQISDKSDLVDGETFHIFVCDATGAINGSTPTTWASRWLLTPEWTDTATPGIWLGNQTGTSRIKLQWESVTPPATDEELAAELVSQFADVSENIKRLNNIRNIRANGATIEVEFYQAMGVGVVWYESTGTAFGAATTVVEKPVDSYGTIVESFEHTSILEGAKSYDGSAAYYVDVVNMNSDYIAFGSEFAASPEIGFVKLRGGANGTGTVDYQSGFDLLNDTKAYSLLGFICAGPTIAEQQGAIDLSASRRNSVTFISPLQEFKDARRNKKMGVLRSWRNENLLRDNSYFFMDDNWGEVYDKYNSVYRFIPCCGGTCGLWFRSVSAAGIGKSPAFYNRGKYLGYRRMTWSANDSERSEIYNELGINSIVSEREGIILMGDKTGLSRTSAFSRINVRGVFIELETNISNTAKYVLGENNDAFTQALFRNSVEPYMRGKVESGEILDYRLKCDSSNNTGQIVSENKFVAGIWVKPQYSINWVYLDFVALRPDMEFSELEGSYGIVTA